MRLVKPGLVLMNILMILFTLRTIEWLTLFEPSITEMALIAVLLVMNILAVKATIKVFKTKKKPRDENKAEDEKADEEDKSEDEKESPGEVKRPSRVKTALKKYGGYLVVYLTLLLIWIFQDYIFYSLKDIWRSYYLPDWAFGLPLVFSPTLFTLYALRRTIKSDKRTVLTKIKSKLDWLKNEALLTEEEANNVYATFENADADTVEEISWQVWYKTANRLANRLAEDRIARLEKRIAELEEQVKQVKTKKKKVVVKASKSGEVAEVVEEEEERKIRPIAYCSNCGLELTAPETFEDEVHGLEILRCIYCGHIVKRLQQ